MTRRRTVRRTGTLALLLGLALALAPAAAASAVPMPTATVSGTVTDGNGDPVPGAVVWMESGSHSFDTVASASGQFQITGVPIGEYEFGAYAGNLSDFRDSGFQVTSGSVTANPVLGIPSSLTGTVTDEAATPIPGVRVRVIFEEYAVSTLTDANGDYEFPFPDIGVGSHLIFFEAPVGTDFVSEWHDDAASVAAATQVDFPITGTAAVVDAELGQAAGSIAGTVEWSGAPAAGAFVKVLNSAGDDYAALTANAAGEFATAGLPDGEYTIIAEWDDGGSAYRSAEVPIVIAGAAVTGVVVDLAPYSDSYTVVGVADQYTTSRDKLLAVPNATGVLANDTVTPSSDEMASRLIAQPANGVVSLSYLGGFIYAPADGFTGTDTFTYQSGPEGQGSGPVTVTIHVTATLPATGFAVDGGLVLVALGVLAAGIALSAVPGRRRPA